MKAINTSVRPAYCARHYGDLNAIYSAKARSQEKRFSCRTERARLRATLQRELLDMTIEQVEPRQGRVRARDEAARRAALRSYEQAYAAALGEQNLFHQWADEQCIPVAAANRKGIVVNGVCVASCDTDY